MQNADIYFSPLAQILLFAIGGIFFVVLSLFISRLIRPSRPNAQKLTTYESGETPQGLARVQFNIKFYVLALVFILFEVEIVFLFPWSTVFANTELNNQTDGAWGCFYRNARVYVGAWRGPCIRVANGPLGLDTIQTTEIGLQIACASSFL